MSSPEKEKKNEKEPSPTLTSLPEDLLLSCLARVSRLYYPILSFVSKRFRSLLVSPELYKIRSILGRTESCLYVCIDSFPNPIWFTLCRKPDQTLTNSSGYVLAKIPDSPPVNVGSLVAVGSSIYNICGIRYKSSNVSILDCTSHTWREAPSFPLELWSCSASVIDRNIYVAGHYEDDDDYFKSSFQVLDTKTQIWNPIPLPYIETRSSGNYTSARIDGKFHVKNYRGEVFAYDSKESRWDMVGPRMGQYSSDWQMCVIENVLYSHINGVLRWYDTEVTEWRKLKGVRGLPKLPTYLKMVDYGGNMVVLWNSKLEIWCAEITLEIWCKSHEIWGKVEWFDRVATNPDFSSSMIGLATIL